MHRRLKTCAAHSKTDDFASASFVGVDGSSSQLEVCLHGLPWGSFDLNPDESKK
jgi:hypothetical protein